jgi:hypothetical protein
LAKGVDIQWIIYAEIKGLYIYVIKHRY